METPTKAYNILGQACQTQTHAQAALSHSTTIKLSAGRSFVKFNKFYCSKAILYQNLSENYSVLVILKSDKIAAARGPPV